MLNFRAASILCSILEKRAKIEDDEKVMKNPESLTKSGVLVELLGRFELPTSSLPNSTYKWNWLPYCVI